MFSRIADTLEQLALSYSDQTAGSSMPYLCRTPMQRRNPFHRSLFRTKSRAALNSGYRSLSQGKTHR